MGAIIFAIGVVAGILLVCYAILASNGEFDGELFTKAKMVMVTHKDGSITYNVLVNGFLGLPFLYRTAKRNFTFEQANKEIDWFLHKRKQKENSKITNKKVVREI